MRDNKYSSLTVIAFIVAVWSVYALAADTVDLTAEQMHLKRQQNLKKASELFLLGKQYFQSGEYAAADQTYKQAQSLLDENANLTDYVLPPAPAPVTAEPKAVKPKPETIRQPRPDKRKADQLYNQALGLLQAGKYPEAEKVLLEVLVYNPKDKDALYNLGVLYDNNLGKPGLAISYYRKYLKLDPWAEDAYQVQGWIEEISKKLSEK